MAIFTEQNGPSLTLTSDREPENSFCYKRLIETPLPGPYFSCTVTLYTSCIVNGSHPGEFTLQYRKSLDRFTRTNSAGFDTIFHSHFGMKDKRGILGDDDNKIANALKDDIDHMQRLSTCPFL